MAARKPRSNHALIALEYSPEFRRLKSDPNSHDWVHDKSPHPFLNSCLVRGEVAVCCQQRIRECCLPLSKLFADVRLRLQTSHPIKQSVGNPKVVVIAQAVLRSGRGSPTGTGT